MANVEFSQGFYRVQGVSEEAPVTTRSEKVGAFGGLGERFGGLG